MLSIKNVALYAKYVESSPKRNSNTLNLLANSLLFNSCLNVYNLIFIF